MATNQDDERVNGVRLRELREAAGWGIDELARMASLSVAQLLEMENGGSERFYTVQIKINATRKVAQILGVPESELVQDPEPVILPVEPESSAQDSAANSNDPAHSSYSLMGYTLLLLIATGAAVWWWGQASAPKLAVNLAASTSVVDPATHETFPSREIDKSAEAPSPVVSSLSDGTSAEAVCTFDGDMVVLQANEPTKPSDKISLMLRKQGKLCVQDATGKVWREELKPWLGRNYMGTAPWKLQSTALFGADVYFQGEKIIVPSDKVQVITLNGKAFTR